MEPTRQNLRIVLALMASKDARHTLVMTGTQSPAEVRDTDRNCQHAKCEHACMNARGFDVCIGVTSRKLHLGQIWSALPQTTYIDSSREDFSVGP